MNNPICHASLLRNQKPDLQLINVDDLNLVETLEKLIRTTKYLKMEFKMKDLKKTKFCLGLQIEHFPTRVLFINYHTLRKS